MNVLYWEHFKYSAKVVFLLRRLEFFLTKTLKLASLQKKILEIIVLRVEIIEMLVLLFVYACGAGDEGQALPVVLYRWAGTPDQGHTE